MITEIKHPTLNISAPAAVWAAAGYTVYSDGQISHGPHGFEALLVRSLVHVPDDEPGAVRVAWAMDQRAKEHDERTRVTAEARMADSIRELALSLRAESAEALIARLPGNIRPYVETVFRAHKG
jgi:hypothetical protein